jgi:Ca2+-binding RTX toxin-like protein
MGIGDTFFWYRMLFRLAVIGLGLGAIVLIPALKNGSTAASEKFIVYVNDEPRQALELTVGGDCAEGNFLVINTDKDAATLWIHAEVTASFTSNASLRIWRIVDALPLAGVDSLSRLIADSQHYGGMPVAVIDGGSREHFRVEACGQSTDEVELILTMDKQPMFNQPIVLPEACAALEGIITHKIVGTELGDYLQGTEKSELIIGLGGDDVIEGGGGNDCIVAGEGNDYVNGGEGDDIIIGNGGTNQLFGGEGNDIIWGDGDDLVDGGRGWDQCRGLNQTNCQVSF